MTNTGREKIELKENEPKDVLIQMEAMEKAIAELGRNVNEFGRQQKKQLISAVIVLSVSVVSLIAVLVKVLVN